MMVNTDSFTSNLTESPVLKIYLYQNALPQFVVSDDGAPGYCCNIELPDICDIGIMMKSTLGTFCVTVIRNG